MPKKTKKKVKRAAPTTTKSKKKVVARSTSKKKVKKKKKADAKLTAVQELFCQQFMIDCNITKAYMRVRPDVSYGVAAAAGCRLMKMAKIQQRLSELLKKTEEETGITVKKVMDNIENTRKRAETDDDYKAELRASELQGKHVGAFEKDNIQRAFVLEIG